MKTYDEVLDMLDELNGVPKADPAAVELKHQRIADYQERHKSLVQDIAANPRTHEMVADLIIRVKEHAGKDIVALTMTSYCNGILIGMAMERQDELNNTVNPPEAKPKRRKRAKQGVCPACGFTGIITEYV